MCIEDSKEWRGRKGTQKGEKTSSILTIIKMENNKIKSKNN